MSENKLHFVKMQGAGNDYIYMDSLGGYNSVKIPEDRYADLSRKVSDRHFGVGSDGLIMILPSADADFLMRIFNADGSEAQMCGNGIRCVAKYVHDKGFTDKDVLKIDTKAGIKILKLNLKDGKVDTVTVDMGIPSMKRREIPVAGDGESTMISQSLHVEDKDFEITGVSMGNPHCVIFVDRVSEFDVAHYGRLIENDVIWPEKTNVEFIEVIDPTHIKMRVWERGSGETFACGTGACAAIVAGIANGLTAYSVEVCLLGGKLIIEYDKKTNHVFMTGPARFVAEGEYYEEV